MKKLSVVVMVVAFVASVSLVQAGPNCGAKSAEKSCVDVMSELDLTEEQQAKMAELKANCATGCSKAGEAKMKKGLQEILTAEQMEKCKTLCDEKGWQCDMSTSEAAKDSSDS